MKPRVNQPVGYRSFGGVRPSYYYGRRHDYIYYPVAWTDRSSGRSYQQGYYDENGRRYDSVAFEKDGKYENVVCHCPYCGRDTILNLTAEDAAAQSLQCPGCGAPMEIRSELDEQASAVPKADPDEARRRKRRVGWLVVLVFALTALIIGTTVHRLSASQSSSGGSQTVYSIGGENDSNVSLYGETVFLSGSDGGAFTITDDPSSDKLLIWDESADSYYDEASECWVWRNTDVEPPVWQYWYEGISSDFGDYGWMEHDDTGWYIEASAGNWIKLPAKYDSGSLWYIDD